MLEDYRKLLRQKARVAIGMTPQSLLVSGFAVLILVGTLLLWLPIAHAQQSISLLDALFTATSAVCVTGLIVVDTGTDFTLFGQVVILLLIQAGGLGVMAFAAMAFDFLGRSLSLRAQSAFNESFFQMDAATGFRRRLLHIVKMVAGFEAVGALLLFLGFLQFHPPGRAAYTAVFHSISAFCNAGFSLYADSLIGFRASFMLISTVMLLIVLGGIGQPVLLELLERLLRRKPRVPRPQRFSLHTQVVLWSSGALIVAGCLFLFATGLAPAEGSMWQRLSGALFQSVTARTAGFNTVDIGALPLASVLLICVLMFVGGSPGSCAGGVKTTTAVLWLAQFTSRIRGKKWPAVLGRHIPGELVRRASTLVGLAILWNLLGVLLLSITEGGAQSTLLRDILFEQLSAFGTVGLSTGLTPELSVGGRLWIILTMFVGRVGPLCLVVWAFQQRTPGVRLPEGKVMIG